MKTNCVARLFMIFLTWAVVLFTGVYAAALLLVGYLANDIIQEIQWTREAILTGRLRKPEVVE